MSDQPESLAAALAAFQAEMPILTKDKDAHNSKYADLVQVNRVVLPVLNRAGLVYACAPTTNAEGKFVLRYRLIHVASGEEITGDYPLKLSENPQQMGSAVTYARRYCLLAVTGVAAEDEDDDGQAASERGTAQRGSRPRQQRQEPRQTAQRGTRAPASAPPLPTEQQPDDQPDMITQAQQARIGALMRDAGITSREDALDRVAEVIGRRVESRTELTLGEADQVVEALDPPSAETDDQ